jgi:hypothetical protein
MLLNILRAYCNYDKEVGYLQGMNYIVAHLIIHLDPEKYQDLSKSFGQSGLLKLEENIFWIFVYINFELNWREVYKKGMGKCLELLK